MPTGGRFIRLGLILLIPLSLKMIRLMCLPRAGPGLGWVGVIRKVYEVDPLLCPTCGGRMRIISFYRRTKNLQYQRVIKDQVVPGEAEAALNHISFSALHIVLPGHVR